MFNRSKGGVDMKNRITLSDLAPGESAVVTKVSVRGVIGRRLLDLGLIAGTKIECISRSPLGDPSAYLIRGAVIAIRSRDCAGVELKPV